MLIPCSIVAYVILVGVIIVAIMRSSQMSAMEGPPEVPIVDENIGSPLEESGGQSDGKARSQRAPTK
ncbi:MAG TPA: hypothetical protein DEP84_08655 [Chloroflexi bacterium]|nr:hypothetical protein [Chloroflexota bacterium]